jgi:hypothetical protein
VVQWLRDGTVHAVFSRNESVRVGRPVLINASIPQRRAATTRIGTAGEDALGRVDDDALHAAMEALDEIFDS